MPVAGECRATRGAATNTYDRGHGICDTFTARQRFFVQCPDYSSHHFVTGEAAIEGNSKIVPGVTVKFDGFGKVFSGTYLVTAATHSYRPEEGYRTVIGFSRNAHSA